MNRMVDQESNGVWELQTHLGNGGAAHKTQIRTLGAGVAAMLNLRWFHVSEPEKGYEMEAQE